MARSRRRDEAGAAALSGLLLIVVLLVVIIAVVLLQRTASTAESINKKASSIAQTGRGINQATDAVMQLDRTNASASSILSSAKPLQGQLATAVNVANQINDKATSINGSASSIDGSAKTINQSAGAINSTASGINSTAAGILNTAKSIQAGVAQINANLDATIGVASQIKGDTGNVVAQAVGALHRASCINKQLGGSAAC